MRGIALAGLAMSVGGAIGILASELVATAHASRVAEREHLVVIATGPYVVLAREAGVVTVPPARALVCAEVFQISGVGLGLRCR